MLVEMLTKKRGAFALPQNLTALGTSVLVETNTRGRSTGVAYIPVYRGHVIHNNNLTTFIIENY